MAEIVLVSNVWPSRALLKAELEERHHTVTGFVTVDEATAALRVGLLRPDLIILDSQELNATVESLRKLSAAAKAVRVLVLTGPFAAAAIDFPSLGFGEVLKKPALIREVVQKVEQIMANRSEA